MSKYHFASFEQYRRLYEKEFGADARSASADAAGADAGGDVRPVGIDAGSNVGVDVGVDFRPAAPDTDVAAGVDAVEDACPTARACIAVRPAADAAAARPVAADAAAVDDVRPAAVANARPSSVVARTDAESGVSSASVGADADTARADAQDVFDVGSHAGAAAHEFPSGAPLDLEAYYASNKDRVACETRRVRAFQILGHSVEESNDGLVPHDLTERVLYWFRRSFPGFENLGDLFAADGAKVFIWADKQEPTEDSEPGTASAEPGAADAEPSAANAKPSTADAEPGATDAKVAAKNIKPEAASTDSKAQASPATAPSEDVSRYYVANILRTNLGAGGEASVATACERDGAHRETVPGGYYEVFWVADDLEAYSLVDAFRLLTRCAFGGWIRDNRWRVDFSRRTFVEWRARKLYFYVPTIG